MARTLELFDVVRPMISASEMGTVRIEDHDPVVRVVLAQNPGNLTRLFRHPAVDAEQSDLDALRDTNWEIVELPEFHIGWPGPP